ncbi:MAG: response regulator transcription factor [Candidatus Fimivivens sp.]
MLGLTEQDYEGLLKFSTYINKGYDKFVENVLQGMSDIFGFQLTTYTIFSQDENGMLSVDRIESNSIYPVGLSQYQRSMFKTDLFVQRTEYARQGVPQKNVLTVTDIATYDEFYSTEYGQYLLRINTPYQAVLRSVKPHRFPVHVLNAFKVQEDGEFTEHERLLLGKIGQVFSDSVGFYKRHIAALNCASFLDVETERTGSTLAVVDSEGVLFYRNAGFMQAAFKAFGHTSENRCIMAIFNGLQQQMGMRIQDIVRPVLLQYRNYQIKLDLLCLARYGQTFKFYFIMLSQHPAQAMQDNSAEQGQFYLVEEYGFTLREVEIAELLIAGRTNPQIGDDLCISIPTVRFHVQNIFKKLDVNRRSAAVAKLLQHQK